MSGFIYVLSWLLDIRKEVAHHIVFHGNDVRKKIRVVQSIYLFTKISIRIGKGRGDVPVLLVLVFPSMFV